MTEPTKDEMLKAWQEFKQEKLFAVLVAHAQNAVELLSIEGTLWGFFYNGYLAGAKR